MLGLPAVIKPAEKQLVGDRSLYPLEWVNITLIALTQQSKRLTHHAGRLLPIPCLFVRNDKDFQVNRMLYS